MHMKKRRKNHRQKANIVCRTDDIGDMTIFVNLYGDERHF